jgi:hypothetical protein
MENKTGGYIYCLSNPCMPGLYKVGMTKSKNRTPDTRAKELSRHTSTPLPFKVEFAKLVKNPEFVEKLIHNKLSVMSYRINPNREFFKVDIKTVEHVFDEFEGSEWVMKKPIHTASSKETPDLSVTMANGKIMNFSQFLYKPSSDYALLSNDIFNKDAIY